MQVRLCDREVIAADLRWDWRNAVISLRGDDPVLFAAGFQQQTSVGTDDSADGCREICAEGGPQRLAELSMSGMESRSCTNANRGPRRTLYPGLTVSQTRRRSPLGSINMGDTIRALTCSFFSGYAQMISSPACFNPP